MTFSQWDMIARPFLRADSIALFIRSGSETGLPSSDTATAPAFRSSAKSVRDSPLEPRVIAAMGKTLARLASRAFSRMNVVTEGLSFTGFVLGMHATAVKPPLTAAIPPVAMVSLYSCPGSLKWTCMSINPGITQQPVASILSSPGSCAICPAGTILMIFPRSIRRSVNSIVSLRGSTTRPPVIHMAIFSVPIGDFLFFLRSKFDVRRSSFLAKKPPCTHMQGGFVFRSPKQNATE
jgi:hypothetical protein